MILLCWTQVWHSKSQQQEHERTKILVEAFPPPPNKNATGTDCPQKAVGSSAQQQKVLAEFTEDELLGFLAFLRQVKSKNKATNGTTMNGTTTNKSTNKSTEPPVHYTNQYFEKLS
jgi:hypothetical protein